MADQDPKVLQDARDKRDVNLKYKAQTGDVAAWTQINNGVITNIDASLSTIGTLQAAIVALNYEAQPGGAALADSQEWIDLTAEIAAIAAIYNTVQPAG